MSDKKAPEKTEQKNEASSFGTPGSVGWGDVGVKPPFKGGGKGNEDRVSLPYLKLEEGKPYRIRLVGKPVKFYSHFDVLRAISPGLDKDVAWQAGNAPRERYAILVLDRNDENKLKVLEAGPSVFNEFKTYFELTGGKDPGDKNGPDWLIQVKVPIKTENGRSFKDKRGTKYNVMRDENAPFTQEEMAYIYAETKKDVNIVQKIKAPTSPELIKEMFEDAKVRGEKDPVPGSPDWWKARREKKQAEGGSDDTPIVPPEGDALEDSVEEPAEKLQEAAPKKGFSGIFEDGDDSDDGDKPSSQF